MISYFIQKKLEEEVEQHSKKVMLMTAGIVLAGVGSFIAYKAIKKQINSVEEELKYLNDVELDEFEYCDKVYSLNDEKEKEEQVDSELEEKVNEFNSRRISCENCNDATREEMQHYLNITRDSKNQVEVDPSSYAEGVYDNYDFYEEEK